MLSFRWSTSTRSKKHNGEGDEDGESTTAEDPAEAETATAKATAEVAGGGNDQEKDKNTQQEHPDITHTTVTEGQLDEKHVSDEYYDTAADEEEVQVEVVTGGGATHKFTLPPTATVLMLKQQVERDTGFKSTEVQLYVHEEALEIGKTLESLRQGKGLAVLITLMVHTPNAQEVMAGLTSADVVLGDGTEGNGVAFVPAHSDWVVTTEGTEMQLDGKLEDKDRSVQQEDHPVGKATFEVVRQVLIDFRESTGYAGWTQCRRDILIYGDIDVKTGWDKLETFTTMEELGEEWNGASGPNLLPTSMSTLTGGLYGVTVEDGKLTKLSLGQLNLTGTPLPARIAPPTSMQKRLLVLTRWLLLLLLLCFCRHAPTLPRQAGHSRDLIPLQQRPPGLPACAYGLGLVLAQPEDIGRGWEQAAGRRGRRVLP
jgi:hypothetical protein